MKAFLALVMSSTLLMACSSSDDGGDNNTGLSDDQGTEVSGPTESTDSPMADESTEVMVSDPSSSDLVVNENNGVTGSSGGEPVTVEIDNSSDLSDEIITDDLLQARQTIIGVWDSLDPATQCLTSISFGDDGQFEQTSLDEVSSGDYRVYLEDEDDATLSLTLSYEQDNELPDCDGNNDNNAGDLFDTYLSFRSPNRMRLSELEGGFGNFIEFDRRN